MESAHCRRIPQLVSVGVLSKVPGAEAVLHQRIKETIREEMNQMRNLLESLCDSLEELNSAIGEFEAVASPLIEDGCSGSEDCQADPRVDSIVCTSMTFRELVDIFRSFRFMHQKELEIKKAVVDDFNSVSTNSGDKRKNDEEIQNFLQVHIVAWMSDIHIQRKYIESSMRKIAMDASMPY